MAINEDEKIRNSFRKVKEEINDIKAKIEELNKKIDVILSNKRETNKTSKEPFFEISSGNDGVINHHQPSSTIINHDLKSIKNLKNELNELYKGLSDREFSVFIAIYTLEEEFGRTVFLRDLANKLKISEITIRGYINTLISKNIPIIKIQIIFLIILFFVYS